MTKVCNKCKKEKDLNEFYKGNLADGKRGKCKTCMGQEHLAWQRKNKEKTNKKLKELRKTGVYKERRRKYYRTRVAKKEKHELDKQTKRNYYHKNKERLFKVRKRWLKSKRGKEVTKLNFQRKIKTNSNFRIKIRLRGRIYQALNLTQTKKTQKTIKLLGCPVNEFKVYIESLWLPGMSWDNYGCKNGQWSFDHVLPCVLFDLTDENQQLICFNYKNIRPLWQIENVTKNDMLPNGRRASEMTKEEKFEYLTQIKVV